MTSKQVPRRSPVPPKGLQRVKHHLKQRGHATLRGLKGMTFRDWLQIAAIPLVIALLSIAGSLIITAYQRQQNLHDLQIQQKQHLNDLQISKDREQETSLQTYFDRMSDLILNNHLKTAKVDEMHYLARTRTLDVLSQLDGERKGEVLRFLNDTDLIKTGSEIVDLSDADLNKANLVGINLRDADLKDVSLIYANMHLTQLPGANLSDADLSDADLSNADLRSASMHAADLRGANLSNANLSGDDLSSADLSRANLSHAKGVTTEQLRRAKSLQGAIMPNGSRHA